MARSEGGFTLIELLVVILIIAILAAIAIPVFLAQREKGWEAQIQSALKNAAIAIESYAIANDGNYGGLNSNPQLATRLAEQGFTIPAWATGVDVKANATDWCMQMTHSLLPATNQWRRSTYDPDVGAPQPVPDSCPAH